MVKVSLNYDLASSNDSCEMGDVLQSLSDINLRLARIEDEKDPISLDVRLGTEKASIYLMTDCSGEPKLEREPDESMADFFNRAVAEVEKLAKNLMTKQELDLKKIEVVNSFVEPILHALKQEGAFNKIGNIAISTSAIMHGYEGNASNVEIAERAFGVTKIKKPQEPDAFQFEIREIVEGKHPILTLGVSMQDPKKPVFSTISFGTEQFDETLDLAYLVQYEAQQHAELVDKIGNKALELMNELENQGAFSG